MKIVNCPPAGEAGKLKISSPGFTLIELMVAMGIIALLAAVMLVGMAGYGKDARGAKALATLSSVLPSIYSCKGNNGGINYPTGTYPNSPGGNSICTFGDGYGKYPLVGSGTKDLNSYSYLADNLSGGDITYPNNGWTLMLVSMSDGKAICCKDSMKTCLIESLHSDGTWDYGGCGRDPNQPSVY